MSIPFLCKRIRGIFIYFAGHDGANFKRLYRIENECGRGGFGTVYSAFTGDGTCVAVKYIARRNVTEWAKVTYSLPLFS